MNIILIVFGILFVLFVIIFRKRIIKTLKYYKDNPLKEKINNKMNGFCKNCGKEIRPIDTVKEIPVHTYSEKRTCENKKTMAEY